jgi:hypothetical protein
MGRSRVRDRRDGGRHLGAVTITDDAGKFMIANVAPTRNRMTIYYDDIT